MADNGRLVMYCYLVEPGGTEFTQILTCFHVELPATLLLTTMAVGTWMVYDRLVQNSFVCKVFCSKVWLGEVWMS